MNGAPMMYTDDVLDAAQIDIAAMMPAVAQIGDHLSHSAKAREHRQANTENHHRLAAPAPPARGEQRLRLR
jgi:hypothetical protein